MKTPILSFDQSDTRDNGATNNSWQRALSESQWTTERLLEYLGLQDHPLAGASAERLFPLRVPKPYLNKIKRGDPMDPLLLQILPQHKEHLDTPGFSHDPLDEGKSTPIPGIVHKYASRALLITTQACAIHCRYCFRRNFPYEEHRLSKTQWSDSLTYISENTDLNEVILSGGDPLSLNHNHLSWLLQQLDDIPHIKRLRIHSRLATTLPQRIDSELLTLFKRLSTRVIMVWHCNHPNELGEDEARVARLLTEAGVTLFNQSVILRKVNDCADTLALLSERLFELGVQPYYLFALDRASGTGHFEVEESRIQQIYHDLQSKLPGFLVPRLAREVAGDAFKRII